MSKIKNRNYHKKMYLQKIAIKKLYPKSIDVEIKYDSVIKTLNALKNIDKKVLENFSNNLTESLNNARDSFTQFAHNINYGIGNSFIKNNLFSENEIEKLKRLSLKSGVNISISDIAKVIEVFSPKVAKENDIVAKLLNEVSKITIQNQKVNSKIEVKS